MSDDGLTPAQASADARNCTCCYWCREGEHSAHNPMRCRCTGECDYDLDPCLSGCAQTARLKEI